MSTTTEKRVVDMQFNNQGFESNAAKTLSTISKLKAALNFTGASQGLDQIEKSANEIKFDRLASSIESIEQKFSLLHSVAVAQFNKIVDKAITAGANIAKAFTLEPITSGFNEYELKLGSIQTILANTISRQKTVSQDAIQEINDAAEAAVEANQKLNEQAIENLQESQAAQTKALQKSFQAQNKAFEKQASEQTKAFEKQASQKLQAFEEETQKEVEALNKSYETKYTNLDKAETKELNRVNQTYQAKYEKLVTAQAKETALLEQAYEAQTKAYETEIKNQTKALGDRFDKETEALEKAADAQLDALEDQHDAELKALEKANDEVVDALQDRYDEQLDALEDYYDEAYEALEKSQEEESKILQQEHDAKLDMYEEEYMAKLKVADEARYNELKAIDDQIDSIKGLAKAEKEEAKEAENRRRLQELEAAVSDADTETEKLRAERKLADFKAKLAEEQAEKEREQQIDALEQQKEAINDAYELKKEQIKEEYEQRKENEADLYEQQKDNLKDMQKAEKKALQKQQKDEKKALQDQKDDELDILKEQQSEAKELLKKQQEDQKEALKETQKVQKKALQEQQELQKEALKEQQKLQKETIDATYENQKAALAKQQELQRQSLENQNANEIAAITKSYEARRTKLQEQQTRELNALSEKRAKEQEALEERIDDEREALNDQIDKQREAIKDRQDAESDALSKRQKAELKAMQESHKQALENIETEKNAKIAAMQAEAGMTKASTLEDVNKALDELNKYADKTIYNFAEMTRNIGTFTAAGVDLDTSVKAIKGIANLAALSGSNAQQASTAMYQLSQAIAGGTLKLEDWNSVQNAGMGGKTFQESLKETARVHGIAVDEMIAKYGSFEYSLQSGWLTSEVLLETLSKFTGDLTRDQLKSLGYTEEQIDNIVNIAETAVDAATKVRTFSQLIDTTKEALGSGWTETFEIIFGNFDEATELWTGVSNIIGEVIEKQADARNQLLTGWKEGGGREDLIQSVKNVWDALVSIMDPIKKAFADIFPPLTSKHLIEISESIKNLTAKFKLSEETTTKVRKIFSGLFAIVKSGSEIFSAFFKAISPITNLLGKLAGKLITWTANFGEYITKLSKSATENKTFAKTAETIRSTLEKVFDAIGKAVDILSKPFEFLRDVAVGVFGKITAKAEEVEEPIDKASEKFEKAQTTISGFIDTIKNWFSTTFGSIDTGFLDNFSEKFTKFKDDLTEKYGGIEGIADALIAKAKELGSKVSEWFGKAKEGVSSFITSISSFKEGKFAALTDWMKSVPDLGKNAAEVLGNLKDKLVEFVKTKFGNINLGFLTDIYNTIKNSIDPAKGFLDNFKAVYEAFKTKIAEWAPTVIDALKNTGKALGDLAKSAGSGLAGGFKEITNFFSDVVSGAKGALDAIKKLWEDIKKFASEHIKAPDLSFITDIVDALTTKTITSDRSQGALNYQEIHEALFLTETDLDELGGKISETSKSIKQKFAEMVDNMTVDDLVNAIDRVTLALVGLASVQFLKSLKSLTETVDNVISDFKGIFEGIRDSIDGLIDTLKEVKNAITVQNIAKISKIILTVAISLKILSSAVKELADLKIEQLLPAAGVIAAFMAELTGAVFLLTKYGGDAKISALALLGFAEALKIVADAVIKLGAMDLISLEKGTVSAMFSLATLAGASFLVGKGGFNANAGAGLMEMAASLLIVQKAIKDFAKLKPSVLKKGGIAAAAAIAALAGASALVGVSGFNASAGAGIVAFSAALLVLQKVLEVFATMSLPEIGRGFVGLVAGLVPLVTAVRSASQGTAQGAAALTIASVALIAIGKAMQMLEGIGLGQILSDLVLFAGILTGLTVAAYALSPVTPTLVALGLAIAGVGVAATGIALAMSAFVASLGVLATTSEVALTAVVVAFGLLARGVLEVIEQLAPAIGDAFKAIILAMCDVVLECAPQVVETVMQVIEQILYSLVDHVPTIVDTIAQLIVQVIDSLTMHVPEIVMSAVQLIETILAAVFEAIKTSGMEVLMDAIMALILLEGLMNKMAALEKVGIQAMKGVLEAGAVIVELGAILAAIGALAQIPGLTWLLGEGIEVLRLVGSAIGQFIGAIIGGILNGISSQLPAIADNLCNFITKLKPFLNDASEITTDQRDGVVMILEIITLLTAATIIDAIGQIFSMGTSFASVGNHLTNFGKSMKPFLEVANTVNESAMKGVQYLAQTLLLITAQDILDGLTSWLTGGSSLSKFGEDLEAFGPHLAQFAKDTAKIRGDQIEGTANALKILAEAAEVVPNSGGVIADWIGDNDLGTFGEQLEKLGPHLAQYAKDTAGVDGSSVEGSANAIKILAEAADGVPNTGGKVAEWIGDNTLDEFGRQLALFGPSLKSYADSIDGIDIDQVKASANAMTILARAATTVPNSGGKLAEWIGDNKLDDFGTQLEGFGGSLKTYADSIAGVNIKKVEASARASMMLTDLANNVPTSGGLLQAFFGDKNLDTFGGQLEAFGGYLAAYDKSIADIDADAITDSANAAGSLAALANNLPEEKGLFAKLFTGDNSLANFGSNLETFGGHLAAYADSVSGMDTTGSTQASTIATTMVNIAILLQNITLKNIKTFGSNVKSFGDNLKNYYNSIKDVDQDKFNTSITNINSIISIADDLKTFENSTFTGFADALQTMADSGISAFADAFDTGYDDCKESINKFIAAVSKGITDKKTSLETPSKTLGESVPSAMVTGMNSKGPDLNTAIQTICTAITNTFKNDLKTSDYKTIGEGMTNGIKSGISSPGQQILSTIKTLCDGLTSKFKTCLPSSTFQTIGSNIVTGIKNGLNNRTTLSNLTSAISLLSSNIVKAFSSYLTAEKTKSYGVNVVNGITAGLNGGRAYVESAARNLAGWINNALSTNLSYNTSRNSAVNFVNGLINGLNGGQSYVVDAAKRVASGVVKVVNTLWNEHSPSKVAEEQGAYYDEGLSLGIKKNANSVYNSIGNVAEGAEAIIEVVGEDIGDAMILAGDGSSEAAASIIDDTETVGESLDDLNSHISNYVDDSVSSYDEWQNSFSDSASNIQNGLYETGDAMDDATAETNEFTDSVNDAEPEVTNLTELMQKAVRVCDDFKIAISNLIETIKLLIQGIDALTDSVGNDKLKVDELTDSFGFITDKISSLTDSLSPLASAIENVAMAFDGMASSAVNSTGELNRYGDTYSDVSSTLGSNSDYLTSGSQANTGSSSGSGSSGYGLYSSTVDDLSSTIDDSITDAMREQKVDLTVDLTKGTVKNNNSGKTSKAKVETESEKKETTTKKKTTTKQKEVLSEHNESGKKQTEYGFAQSSVKSIASMIDFSTTSALLQSTATELANTQKATQAAQEENDRVTQELLKTIQTQAANNNTSNIENTNVFYISSTDPQESAQEVGRVLQKQVERSKAVWAL